VSMNLHTAIKKRRYSAYAKVFTALVTQRDDAISSGTHEHFINQINPLINSMINAHWDFERFTEALKLISGLIDVDVFDCYIRDAMFVCVSKSLIKYVTLLLDNTSNRKMVINAAGCAIHEQMSDTRVEILKFILNLGVPINHNYGTPKRSSTMLWKAIYSGQSICTTFLLANGARPDYSLMGNVQYYSMIDKVAFMRMIQYCTTNNVDMSFINDFVWRTGNYISSDIIGSIIKWVNPVRCGISIAYALYSPVPSVYHTASTSLLHSFSCILNLCTLESVCEITTKGMLDDLIADCPGLDDRLLTPTFNISHTPTGYLHLLTLTKKHTILDKIPGKLILSSHVPIILRILPFNQEVNNLLCRKGFDVPNVSHEVLLEQAEKLIKIKVAIEIHGNDSWNDPVIDGLEKRINILKTELKYSGHLKCRPSMNR
jgi:hypothetical protein